jgi:hypothetical protein
MRFTTVLGAMVVSLVGAGCFNPRITDGGFACDPTDSPPCPEGYFCRDFNGAYLCTTNVGLPFGPDMAMSSGGGAGGGGGGGGGGGDVDMATPAGAHDMAMLPPDMTPLPTNCTATSLLINEVQTGSGTSAKDEWVEIFNPCGNAVTLAGTLVYRSDTNNGSTDTSTLATIASTTIAPGGYYLIANSDYAGSHPADVKPFSNTGVGMADGGGGVGVRDNSDKLLFSMGWGSANNTFQKGSAAPAEGTNKSIARTPNGASTGHDNLDFKSATPTPGAAN